MSLLSEKNETIDFTRPSQAEVEAGREARRQSRAEKKAAAVAKKEKQAELERKVQEALAEKELLERVLQKFTVHVLSRKRYEKLCSERWKIADLLKGLPDLRVQLASKQKQLEKYELLLDYLQEFVDEHGDPLVGVYEEPYKNEFHDAPNITAVVDWLPPRIQNLEFQVEQLQRRCFVDEDAERQRLHHLDSEIEPLKKFQKVSQEEMELRASFEQAERVYYRALEELDRFSRK